MHLSQFVAGLIASAAVLLFCGDVRAAPLLDELSPALSLVVQVGFNCGLVDGKLVCGGKKSHTQGSDEADDSANSDHHDKKGKKDGSDKPELTECTIQESKGGGGCVTGFKHVCEKLKNGKKCCGCVPDKNAQATKPKPVQRICCTARGPDGKIMNVMCSTDSEPPETEAQMRTNLQKLLKPTSISCAPECLAANGSVSAAACK